MGLQDRAVREHFSVEGMAGTTDQFPAVDPAELLDFRSAVFRGVLTVAAFPLASLLLGRTQRALMGAA